MDLLEEVLWESGDLGGHAQLRGPRGRRECHADHDQET